MSIITPTREGRNSHLFSEMAASDVGAAIETGANRAIHIAAQAVSGGGSGFNGGVVTLQVSNDGTNWFTPLDYQGAPVVMTAANLLSFSTAAKFVRPIVDASVANVDVKLRIVSVT